MRDPNMSLESEKEKYLSDLKQDIRNTVKAKIDSMADNQMMDKGYIEDTREKPDSEEEEDDKGSDEPSHSDDKTEDEDE